MLYLVCEIRYTVFKITHLCFLVNYVNWVGALHNIGWTRQRGEGRFGQNPDRIRSAVNQWRIAMQELIITSASAGVHL
jgi:hypothetical protein